jgi:RHS repeat-associated protein
MADQDRWDRDVPASRAREAGRPTSSSGRFPTASSAAGSADPGGFATLSIAREPTAGGSRKQPGDFRLPSIELPKGGGALRGIDEKLTVDQATGAASLTVPVATSAARQGGLNLGVTYSSGAGNGPFGMGWSLSVPSISRKTAKRIPRYRDDDDTDVFVHSGQDDLVPDLVTSSEGSVLDAFTVSVGPKSFEVRRYRPRVEGEFTRIERWRDTATGDVHWRAVSRDNVTSIYGQDLSSRIADPDNPSRVFSWLLDLSFDDRGNAISYEYKAEDAGNVPAVAHESGRQVTANRYLKRIFYGNDTPYLPATSAELPDQWCFQVVFDYGEHDPANPQPAEATTWPCRADPFSTYRPGFEVRTYRICRRVLMFHQFLAELGAAAVLVSSVDFGYSTDDAQVATDLPVYSLLTSTTRTGYVPQTAGYQIARLPPVELGYSALAVSDVQQIADPESLENLTGDLGSGRQRWVDLDGEALQGILTEDDFGWYYKHNLSAWNTGSGPRSARFGPLELVDAKPPATVSGAPLQLAQLNGDGKLCAVTFAAPGAGYFERTPDGGWEPFKPLAITANVDWASPNLTMVDLDGDGLADVLLTEDEVLTWHQWEPFRGFGPAEWVRKPSDEDEGPALVLADGTGSIRLADMSGDGLADLVRIRNGEVCYWPNLGYGRFGAKITMDGDPVFDYPDRFDQKRIRLADIDGSGTADLIYLGSDTVTIWFNQSGNSWTLGRELKEFPAVDSIANVSAFDLLGAGTACLVWTSPLPAETFSPLRYIDLTSGIKPYLLTSVTNNMGAETSLCYAPSTKFYLQDCAAGVPWVTRLPFPVHVVEQVETTEGVTRTSLASQYSYHHGYYDGIEREFRGFAHVDQLDTEALPAASGTGQFTSTPQVDGEDFTLPPVRIRTWYHTGAYIDGADIAARLAAEYYQLDPEAPQLGATMLPVGASAEEEREACRALRGRTLRQEVYALDDTPAAVHPYFTSEHCYQVQMLQPRHDHSYASFQAWELEALTCHYERNPDDPRISHELTLEVDEYGNVTKAASVGYQRRVPAFPEQESPLLSYTEHDVINVTDQAGWYRVGLPAESRTYELTGITPGPGNPLYDPYVLCADAADAADIPFEATATMASPQRRLIARSRTIYDGDDLSGPLSFCQADPLALVHAVYRLHYTPGLLASIFGARIAGADLAALGGYLDLDTDGSLWSTSARPFYSPDAAAPDPAFALQHFYLPQGATDPWGNVAYVIYDTHDLLVTQTTDAAGNITQAASNYRLLRPWLVTDPNLNRTGVRYDALGMVAATALMGKLLPDGTDEGDHLDTSTDEPAPGDDPTTCLDYDLSAYQGWAADPAHDPDHPAPVWVHSTARVRHKDPSTPWLQAYAYSDGLGRVALAKAQAEAGPAPERGGDGSIVIGPDGALVFAPTATRWVGSGRVVYDNKGNPVKAYEPFFDSSSVYDDETDLVSWGVTAITRYDPLGRAFKVDNPNGTFRTIEFDPWSQVSSDETDTVLASDWYQARQANQLGAAEADAAAKAATAASTPSRSDFDSLGRVFRTLANNGPAGEYQTLQDLDIQGNVRAVTDALGRRILTQDYSMTGAEIHRLSVDAGQRWMALDSVGRLLQAWDSRGTHSSHDYDMLRRPTAAYVTEGASPEFLAEQITYGEGLAEAIALNLRRATYQQQDEAGIATIDQRDFKGNILSASRQMLQPFSGDVDWSQPQAMNPETFLTATTYDALNRPVTVTTPDGSVSSPVFNDRSLLAQVTARIGGAAPATSFVTSVSYDAKGQRELISYGNGTVTSYDYDPDTFRLIRLQTSRPTSSNPLQDLAYTYDPVGNVTQIADAAQPTVYFANQVVPASASYTYDAIYRLTAATGRELIGLVSQPQTDWNDSVRMWVPLPTDGQAMRNYTETYAYDQVGNFTSVVHSAANGSWTRTYAYNQPTSPPANNQLTSTTVGTSLGSYTYDPNGNMNIMPQLGLMTWDWKNQLQSTALQALGNGASQVTNYRYDSSGQRIRKVTASPAGAPVRERSYLGGYEVYREYAPTGAVTLERQSLHISDGAKLVCLIETTAVDNSKPSGAPSTATRYQFGNLLGSAVLELDPAAMIISYEEYYPYGSTSLQTGPSTAEVSLKRYRYTGKERDEETGLYYHGARYYAPWLGRWTSCDPAGLTDGTNVYGYARENPIRLVDPTGANTLPPPSGPWHVNANRIIRYPFRAGAGEWKTPRAIRESMDRVSVITGFDPKTQDAGHEVAHWQQRAGEIGHVRNEPALGPGGNRSRGATIERPAAQAAAQRGDYTRVRGNDPTAPAGVKKGPTSLWHQEPSHAPPPEPSRPSVAPPLAEPTVTPTAATSTATEPIVTPTAATSTATEPTVTPTASEPTPNAGSLAESAAQDAEGLGPLLRTAGGTVLEVGGALVGAYFVERDIHEGHWGQAGRHFAESLPILGHVILSVEGTLARAKGESTAETQAIHGPGVTSLEHYNVHREHARYGGGL